jgi:DNA-directed RNA polymerase subunit RPC12/RpoP
LSNALHQSVVIEEIRKLNEDAVIVLVGTYNDLEGIVLDVSGTEADLGTTMQDLVNASNLLATKNAAAFSRVAYVDATDVTTTLDSSAADQKTPNQYVLAIVGRQGLPNADGHAYIAKQIQNAISDTCTHIWQEGVVTTKPTCENAGVMTYVCDWCGESYDEPIEATGHAWDDGVVTKEPTATEDGVRTYTCAHCGATRTEVIEKTGDVDVKIGDVNGDGRINARDARALLRFIAGLAEDGEVNEAAADYDNNGKVNARDARALLRSIAGLE